MTAIDSIPDSVIEQGDSAVNQWLAEKAGPQARASFWGCAGAITLTLASTLIPVAKIIQIRRYMKALGGTWEAVRLMWGASFSYEKMRAAGGALAALAAELFGIKQIQDNCFS